MIEGIGIDIVAIDRMASLSETALRKLFHPLELKQALEISGAVSSSRNQYLAGRFAAKEAFGKALGCGMLGLLPHEICTQNGENGRPYIVLYGSAKEKLCDREVLISISHDSPMAAAMVLLQGKADGAQ